ncbi:PrsW family intramembrane metalloprotease [Cutibacterium equinum]|uniref:PrsW family intramembrane metalloprotease n=1 Tax=Cutibacterium equinum TaxID=3016342 RepID=A0ABY7QWB2_9ACTN|nr:PrsW family intramembrane metalloprotease [Cutibacterium equinum]WCC79358.1 PrsW family intramembrane metalloprotease [Cutibacterium equinum]
MSYVAPAPVARRPWWQRLLRNPWFWVLLVLVVASAASLVHTYDIMHADTVVDDGGQKGVIPGITNRSFKLGLHYAWPTAAVWSVIFILVDRFRTRHLHIWFLCFCWGACIATWISLHVNTWMAGMLSVAGGVDPASGAGPAVYSAPFVEESCKAMVLFGLAVFTGRRMTSMLQTVSMAGLSAIGFAFVENIMYYARADNYARVTAAAGDPKQAVLELVMLRGVYTSFGHPLFTSMTGIGLALGLRSRSRLVRILAPTTGFVMAVLGHMLFNGFSSVLPVAALKKLWYIALGIVASVVVFVIIRMVREGTMIRNRLEDYVKAGWLPESDADTLCSLPRRKWAAMVALSQGPRRWWNTLKFLRTGTNLAYLRDEIVRGLDDDPGTRQIQLINDMNALRPIAVTVARGAKLSKPRLPAFLRRRHAAPIANELQWAPPQA